MGSYLPPADGARRGSSPPFFPPLQPQFRPRDGDGLGATTGKELCRPRACRSAQGSAMVRVHRNERFGGRCPPRDRLRNASFHGPAISTACFIAPILLPYFFLFLFFHPPLLLPLICLGERCANLAFISPAGRHAKKLKLAELAAGRHASAAAGPSGSSRVSWWGERGRPGLRYRWTASELCGPGGFIGVA